MKNLFALPATLPESELAEPLTEGAGVLIERIISCGQTSPPDFWYDQDRDEWVALLQGEAVLAYADGRRVTLAAGDWLLISAREKHRVEYTSSEPPCIWLAVHGKLSGR